MILAGDGPETDRLRAKVDDLELHELVSLPGYLADGEKAKVLMNSEIFVFPTSHGEGCPVALLEAMAAGQAIITTAVGGIPDIFQDEENGTLLGSTTTESIAEAMSVYLRDGKRRADVGNRNRKYAWTNFEASVVTEKIRFLYKDLLSA